MTGHGVTAAAGFRAAGVAAGLRSSAGPDVALIVNDGPRFDAAAVFTTNRVKAAPVRWTERLFGRAPDDRPGRLPSGPNGPCGPNGPIGPTPDFPGGAAIRAVVLNAGGANACTGPDGYADTVATAERVAAAIGAEPDAVAVCSTGLIGERLAMPALLAGVDGASGALAATAAAGADAALAIITTDTVPKTAEVRLGGFVVGGMAKGAGMLAPGLATMLVVMTTDAEAGPAELDAALRAATRVSFDRIDSDGAMSTNDTVLVMASGASGVRPDPAQLTAALTRVCEQLATALIGDAEGATKEIAIEVRHAATEDDAVEVGRAIARNNLVKTALFGEDPNWGRILAAVGTAPSAAFDPDAVDVSLNGVEVCRAGGAGDPRTLVDLSGRSVQVMVDLHAGTETATIRTNDLSHAYVHENSAYST